MSIPAENPSSQTAGDVEQTAADNLPVKDSATNSNSISLPRWIVYFQGAMLGVVAATFFVFGLMVGNLTSGAGSMAEQKINCRVSGQVTYSRGDKNVPDINGVVLLLPVDKSPDQRADSAPVHPDSFEPLDNPAIDSVTFLGGAIVRVNEQGSFDVTIDGPQEYYLLIVSAHKDRDESKEFTKQQKAAIGTFFRPAEGVIGDQAFYWLTLYADRDSIELSEVHFD